MTTPEPNRPLLEISFEGPSIKDGRILLDDLLLFLGNIQSAVARIINVMETGRGIRTGRPPRGVQVLSALEVVAVSRGSFKMALDLRREQELLPEFDVGERAVESLTGGIECITTEPELPRGYDQGVLMALREASRIFDRGVSVVHLVPRKSPHAPSARFVPATREQIITRLQRFEEAWAVVEGRLLMADVKEEALRCRLHPSAGEPIMCSFAEDMVPLVAKYLRGFVRAKGEATVEIPTNKVRNLVIRDIEPIEEPSGIVATVEVPSSFWKAAAFDELAAEQGVYPIDDLDKITGGWPEDADFDSFLESIRSIRTG
jgi:hypothetical protein